MTRAIRNRVLKDANGDISDHIRNHIHLTNCIHLKNHMHKNSPIIADRSIMRDLVVLQRSRSLRDPSASPPSWHSPSVVDLLFKRADNDGASQGGRRSVGNDSRKEGGKLSKIGNSPPLVSKGTSRVAPGEGSRGNDAVPAATSERSSRSGIGNGRRVGREESGRKSNRPDYLEVTSQEQLLHEAGKSLAEDVVSRHSQSIERKSRQLCLALVLVMSVQFLWTNASGVFSSDRKPSKAPRLVLPKDFFVNIATAVGAEVNRGLRFLQNVSCGGNLKQFVIVVVCLWAGAVIGNWFNFFTVVYIGFVAAHTLPVLYEKYDDQIDNFVYKVLDQMQNQYRKVDSGLLSKIPKGKKLE